MLLDGAVIKYRLSKELACSYKVFNHDIKVDLPIFFDEALDLSGHIVVLDRSRSIQIVQRYDDVIFVCQKDNVKSIINSSNNIIIVEDNVPITKIFNLLLQIFVLFNDWETKMKDDVNRFALFPELFSHSECILDQAMFLMDSQFHCIGYSKKYSNEYSFNDLNLEQARQLMTSPNFKSLESIKDVFQYVSMKHCLHKNIFYNDTYVGRMGTWHSADEDRNAYYSCILTYLSKYLELLYLRCGSFKRDEYYLQLLKKFVTEIIDGNTIELNNIKKLLEVNDYQTDDEYYLIQLRTDFTGDTNIYANYIGPQLEIKWPGICCIENKTHILILLNSCKYHRYCQNDFFHELKYFIRDSMLIAGISRKFKNFEDIRAAYNQTNIAFELGKINNPMHWNFKFDDYAFDYILKYGIGKFTPDQVSSTVLIKLREHDKDNNTQYYVTLFEYIKNQYNATLAAKSLYIARSSFICRMNRIKELTGVTLDNFTERLYLMISYQLYANEDSDILEPIT